MMCASNRTYVVLLEKGSIVFLCHADEGNRMGVKILIKTRLLLHIAALQKIIHLPPLKKGNKDLNGTEAILSTQ